MRLKHLAQWNYCAAGLRPLILSLAVMAQAAEITAAPNYGLDSRPPIGAFLNNRLPPVAGVPSGAWTVEIAFPNLTFEDPVFFLPEPGGSRSFVGGRQGYIWSFLEDPNVSTKTLVLDISPRTQGWEACGLLGMAFHPQWRQAGSPNRGYIYVWYQFSDQPLPGPGQPPADTPGFNRLSRFTIPDGSLVADPNSEQVLIHQYDRHVWHNGGGIFFGDDGFLYLSTGDEGGLGDPYDTTQRLNGPMFSGVIRIDVDRDPARSHPIRRQPVSGGEGSPASYTANYYIPNDNPFLDPAGNILEEFWAIGLRSPHRMTLDRPTQTIWLGDVGQDNYEEVSIIEKGGNYQWPFREGLQPGSKPRPDSIIGTEQPPIYEYPHDFGNNCVIGGYIYRGDRFPELTGRYIFGDNGSSRIWAMTYNGINPPTLTELCQLPGTSWTGLSSFGLDRNNEIYLCKVGSAGRVYRLTKAGAGSFPMPSLLSQTGVFTNINTMAVAPGLIPFGVNTPLWSDRAEKLRWIALPNNGAPYGPGEQIAFSATGEWDFPNGTVFVKHFDLPTDDTNPSLKKRLETRLLVRNTNGSVYGFTYKWRANNSDADLVTNSLTEPVVIRTATGTRTENWYYPSPRDCIVCHNGNARHVLGVKTRQLNGNFNYPATGRTDHQLRTWNHLGMFNPPLDEGTLSNYLRLEPLTNTAASLETRARSYVDANCSQCHRPGGVVQAYFDARFDTPLAAQGIVNGRLANTLGIADAKVIAPASVPRSVMHFRMNHTNPQLQMPPLARNLVDTTAVNLFAQWIGSLPPTGVLPAPWRHQDIGAVSLEGDANESAGLFTLSASGEDIWDAADAFHFAYQDVSGDAEIVVRITGLSNSDPWAKGGLMFRQNLAEDSPNVMVFATPQHGTGLQYRETIGGPTFYLEGPALTVPCWLKLVRTRSVISGYSSVNGMDWTLIGSRTMALPNGVRLGLAATAHNAGALTTATFDNVRVKQGPPAPWENRDVGAVGLAGNASYSGGVFSVSGSGRDIWDPADSFHFVYQRLAGDGEITARVNNVADTDPWAKAGVIWRQDFSTDSPHAMIFLTPGHGVGFQSRVVAGGAASYVEGPLVTAPYWLKLVRTGNNLQGYSSPDGSTWTLNGAQSIPPGASNYVGLAVTAHNQAALNTAVFDSVRVTSTSLTPLRLTLLKREANGWVRLRVDGPTNRSYRIEASPRLTNWSGIFTQFTASGTVLFTNRNAVNLNHHFYRAALP